MGLDFLRSDLVLFNYYSFGSLLVTITTFFLAVFFLSLKRKTVATYHLGIAFLVFGLFEIGYFMAAFYYHPIAAYHRWLTGCLILPTITHFTQFFIRYPNNYNKKFGFWMMVFQHLLGFVVACFFIYLTFISEKIYHFTAHHWDFNALIASKYLALLIALYSVIAFIIVPSWRIITDKERKRFAIFLFSLGFMIAAFYPNIANVLSRDGYMERSTYMTSNVIFFIAAFSVVVIVFINSSTEKTTFMVKIVGVTLFTICLIMQALVFISNQDKESEYDSLHIVNSERVLESGRSNGDVQYALRYDGKTGELITDNYDSKYGLDLSLVKVDLQNTLIYEEIAALKENNFREHLKVILDGSPEYFAGHRDTIYKFVKENSSLSSGDLKKALLKYAEDLNRDAFVNTNKLQGINSDSFCEQGKSYLEKNKDLESYKNGILKNLEECIWKGKKISGKELKAEFLKYFSYFKPAETRHYRRSVDGFGHHVAFMKYVPSKKQVVELGFSYKKYREFVHPTSVKQTIILFVVIFVVLVLFPLFFKSSLVNPLNNLLSGVEKVNKGDLDVRVPVKVRDEIGFLADSFNSMVSSIKQARRELQDYAENLEEKVKERTQEVQEKMEEVQRLKIQQDGDYFLTSLLAKPLFYNANKSKLVHTEFMLKQKKQFEFRGKHSDLGGDICITGNLRLGVPGNYKRYTMVMNGDAMGKSMQGAGGALVMGVVMNSIMARSAANNRILDKTPSEWLKDVYNEIHSVFKSFNGSMVISAAIFLIEEETGKCFYFNAEHPFTVLYRDGKASFLETGLQLRKLGLDSEFDFQVQNFELKKGDVLILGSDGRDDIDLTSEDTVRTINEDENLFLLNVENGKGNLEDIETEICKHGELTDDLSLLKVEFQAEAKKDELDEMFTSGDRIDVALNPDVIYEDAKQLYKNGKIDQALELLKAGYTNDTANQKINKLLGLLSFKGKDYTTAIEVLNNYLKTDPGLHEYWFYLSIANKKVGKYEQALEASLKLNDIQPDNLSNLVNLSDIYRLMDQFDLAEKMARKLIHLDPGNQNGERLLKLIERDRA
ncbi:SpoIIE family protein phosphatase [Leptospira borgpetersenii]|uniref:SpoIIE family protein phosphatase n=1 Tax=Leptospira borgpetersenii TaxID=174 RepID=UPI00077380D3|nr:SpoIIE family protein phosphatase [Leptospira borgpetersenii]MBE8399178.1 SpoIIE family protein phosphatase [Leptospira borgpetersenii serovar Tarassovi]MBE8402238.1 SpoIIE family protein phosphatase [Leptospira borgpetersenii serovar Tarassovi]MBE8407432.1 SpoIIE family protein phosphatase [Leptospira borgpetersenii serovar Tarassovi]MBE8411509.1 SpoIIE family protein phosphatase [Leptospira borgpetersenii serovar Tarassovi]MBE8417241.1 SpoIIE family protein phosphatase [Leptospira borgpet